MAAKAEDSGNLCAMSCANYERTRNILGDF